MSPFARRFRRVEGGIRVDLPPEEQELLAEVVDQLRDMLMADADPNLRRLKPPARPDDDDAEADYQAMAGDELLRSRLEAIEQMELDLTGAVLDEVAVAGWMQTLNGLRLVLGERLQLDDEPIDVEPDDPDAAAYVLYDWLSGLLDSLVRLAVVDLRDPD